MAPELFGERHEFARILATRCPVDRSLILLELRDLAEPEGASFVRDGDDVGNITGPEAAADAQLDAFEKPSRAPFFLKPLHRDGRPLSVLPQQQSWQTVRCPMTMRLVVSEKLSMGSNWMRDERV